MKYYIHIASLLCCCLACGQRADKTHKIPAMRDSVLQTTGANPPAVSTDEQLFTTFFTAFKQAVKKNDQETLKSMIHFPLQTDFSGKTALSEKDYKKHADKIFHQELRKRLPSAKESVVDRQAEGVDEGSVLYAVHMLYPEQRELAFGFVFGRVDGVYKIIGYRSKWE